MGFTPPTYNLKCNLFSDDGNLAPHGPAFAVNVPCNARSPRVKEDYPLFRAAVSSTLVVLGFAPGQLMVDATVAGIFPALPHLTVIEFPAGSGQFYTPVIARMEARGFPNQHLNVYCDRRVGVTTPQ